jgi:hypothetical protein
MGEDEGWVLELVPELGLLPDRRRVPGRELEQEVAAVERVLPSPT